MTLIKSIAGIRGTIGGTAGDNLTPIDIVKFTSAYATWVRRAALNDGSGAAEASKKRLKVVVGRDARISGAMVEALVHGTLTGCGVDVIDAGLCTTPGVEMAVVHYGADGGIILTASHNPRQWNALKLLDSRGEFLNAEAGAEILRMVESGEFTYPQVDELGRVIERVDFLPLHIAAVLALPAVDAEAVRAKKFRVAVDAVNSVGGVAIPALLEALGCQTVCLNCEPTGDFAHNPEPLPEHLTEISTAVVREKADLGVVVDPDVDRLALINEDGTMFGEEYTLVVVADYVLGATKGAKNTVSNLSSTRALNDITRRHGGEYFAAAVGEVNVVARMKETGAVIGGEGNGGVIYPELHYGRDALVVVALFLTHLARSGKTMTTLRATYPEYVISKNRIDLAPDMDVDAILEAVKTSCDDGVVNDVDGVKIDYPDGWVHLRRSNTEPIIRVYSEAASREAADALAKRVMIKIDSLQ
ncbi:MAG: phosphoglucosamine mutase [Alistipes sp.]|jgi:phosphomannomutase|nr:phosphoglucosamine mutase [Alistipes sp.]